MRPGRILALALVLLAGGSATAGAQDAPPPAVPLDAGWEVLADPAGAGLAAGYASGTAGEGWARVTLPHVFQPRPVEDGFGGSIGWYRLRFDAPRAAPRFGWAIRFEQVRRVAHVWLNGQALATHRDPYVPFEIPLRGLRDTGNVLVVRVDWRKSKEPREGWWNWGGISKPAHLVPRGELVAETTGVLARRECRPGACRWSALTDVEIVNRGGRTIRPQIAVRVQAPDSGPVSEKTVTARPLAPGEKTRVRFDVPVNGRAQLWSPDSPRLYDAVVQVREAGGAVLQSERRRVGLRWVDVRDGLLRLNGRAVELRGASIQEDLAGRGPALRDADVATIVSELRALGANVTRAHYLLDERLLRRFDEEGILVWSQAPIYHRDRLLETPEQRLAALRSVRGTVLGARNHPSVITHSVANELSVIPDDVPGTRRFLDAARALTRDLDPTLPVSVDLLSYPGYPRQETYAKFPLLGINSYFGWYPGKKDHPTGDVRDLAPFLQATRRMYPRAALVLTEFGAESTFDGPPTVKETFGFQADYVRTVLDIVERSHFVGGAIYWTLREFAVKPDWDGGAKREGVERDGIHNKGLITYAGERKPAWTVLASNIRATPMWRSGTEVAAATGRPRGDDDRGVGGAVMALGAIGLLLSLVLLNLWAFAGLRRVAREEAAATA